MFQKINDQLAIGDETTQERLQALAQQGYTTVVDLCTFQEGNILPEAPVKKVGLVLQKVPVSTQSLHPALIQQFLTIIQQADGPVYVRCASGRRAALMAFLTQATQQHWTTPQFFEYVEASGFDCSTAPQLAEFAREYMDTIQNISSTEKQEERKNTL